MPMETRSASSTSGARRSARLVVDQREETLNSSRKRSARPYVEIGPPPRGVRRKTSGGAKPDIPAAKKRRTSSGTSTASPSVKDVHDAVLGITDVSRAITDRSLAAREQALVKRELALQEKLDAAMQREAQAAYVLAEMDEQAAKDILAQFEDHFTCSMCFDVMACPQTLSPPACGHTFCATCILKWFFANLHECGSWHEVVDCPLCRCPLVVPPELPPRPMSSFPCTPARLVEQVLRSLVERLAKLDGATSEDAKGWQTGGKLRLDWEKRTRDGLREVNKLKDGWMHMKNHSLLVTQIRLSAT